MYVSNINPINVFLFLYLLDVYCLLNMELKALVNENMELKT